MNKNILELEKPLLEFEKKIEELKELAYSMHTDISDELGALEKWLMREKRSIYFLDSRPRPGKRLVWQKTWASS